MAEGPAIQRSATDTAQVRGVTGATGGSPASAPAGAIQVDRAAQGGPSVWLVYGIPAFAALCLCIPKLWQGGWTTDTPWYSAIALDAWREALDGNIGALWTLPGIGGTPASGGERYFNKPPLAFWLNGLPLLVLGPTILAARLGSMIACILCVLLVSHLARRASGSDGDGGGEARARLIGLFAGLILALTWEFTRHARSFSLDLWLVVFLLVALWGAVEAVRRSCPYWLAVTGLGVGLSLMTKPLVGLLTLPILALWFSFELRAAPLRRSIALLALTAAAIIALAIAAPWHISMHLSHGEEFSRQYFGAEIASRAGGAGTRLNASAANRLYYPLLLAKAYWPWIISALLACASLVDRRTPRAARRWLVACAIWLLIWLIAMSLFADKRPRYALVLYPVGAWMSAIWLVALAPLPIRRLFTLATAKLVAIVLALVCIALSLAPIRFHRPDNPQWAALFVEMRSRGVTPRDIYAAALEGQHASRLYLEYGRWPIPTYSVAGELLRAPPRGSFILYHARDGRAPGPGEEMIWSEGDLTLTRLEADGWSPEAIADPGERRRD